MIANASSEVLAHLIVAAQQVPVSWQLVLIICCMPAAAGQESETEVGQTLAPRCRVSSFNLQAIERSGTGITYLQLLMSMSQALEQLSAQQGKLPPKLPTEVGGMFGGLLNKLVTSPTQTGFPLNAQPCLLVPENGEISTQAFTSKSNSCTRPMAMHIICWHSAGQHAGQVLQGACLYRAFFMCSVRGIADGWRNGHGRTQCPDACAVVQLPF